MKVIQMTMDNELVERIDARVKALGTTRSAFASEALRDALKRLDEKELEDGMWPDTSVTPSNRVSLTFRKMITLAAKEHGCSD